MQIVFDWVSFAIPKVMPRLFKGLLLFLVLTGPLLGAVNDPPVFVLDLPFQNNQATPAWLGHPATPPGSFAALNLPITPQDEQGSLLVTLYFHEKEGGFLRLTWQGTNGASVLSDNFYEGIGMDNQRSLLIPAQTLLGGGTLGLQCGDVALGVKRIKLEWLCNRDALVSPQILDTLVTPATGPTQPAHVLDGQPNQAEPAAWHDQIVTVPITDAPERIEEGVEFNVQLDQVPHAARLALKEAGLGWQQHLVVWVNQRRSGTVTPAVPNLLDHAFLADAATGDTYVGWRDGAFYVPVSFLKQGVNTVQFSVEDDTATGTTAPVPAPLVPVPLAVKEVALQLDYPPPPVVPAASPAATPATTATSALLSLPDTLTNSPASSPEPSTP